MPGCGGEPVPGRVATRKARSRTKAAQEGGRSGSSHPGRATLLSCSAQPCRFADREPRTSRSRARSTGTPRGTLRRAGRRGCRRTGRARAPPLARQRSQSQPGPTSPSFACLDDSDGARRGQRLAGAPRRGPACLGRRDAGVATRLTGPAVPAAGWRRCRLWRTRVHGERLHRSHLRHRLDRARWARRPRHPPVNNEILVSADDRRTVHDFQTIAAPRCELVPDGAALLGPLLFRRRHNQHERGPAGSR